MKKLLAPVASVVLAWSVLLPSGAAADSGSATFAYWAGTGFICGLPVPNPCPDVARAENGDTVSINDTGTISIHPKSAPRSGRLRESRVGDHVDLPTRPRRPSPVVPAARRAR